MINGFGVALTDASAWLIQTRLSRLKHERHGPHHGGCGDCRGVVTIDSAR